MTAPKPTNTDEYIAMFPQETRNVLERIRATIQTAAPEAEEGFSYGIPTFRLHGKYLIYFAGYKKHVSLYPVNAGDAVPDERFASYKISGKGTLQFELDKPVPYDLIANIVRFRVAETQEKSRRPKTRQKREKSPDSNGLL